MKRIIFVLISVSVLVLAGFSAAQTQPASSETQTQPVSSATQTQPASSAAPAAVAAAPVRPNTAIIPQLSPGFVKRHEGFVEIAKKGDIDLLFLGDSITDFWRNIGKPVFDSNFASYKTANFGIAGDTTQGVLWRLQNGEGQGYKPKAIMLMIGTNNTGRNTSAEIALGVAAVVFELQRDFPDAKILLLGIFPRGRADQPVRQKIADINKIISCLHDNQHVFYMDIGDKFLAPDGSIPREVMNDGLHPSAKGYVIWAQAVKETLDGFLK
jgi:lysophospholipase L1-like esterase